MTLFAITVGFFAMMGCLLVQGVLMIGISTAAITTVVQDALERRAHLKSGSEPR